ncbi:MAG: sugar MFS transporter [Dehalococcoidia bacterium]
MSDRPSSSRSGIAPVFQPDSDGRHRTAVRICWAALFNIGVYTALLGPVLPEFAERTDTGLGTVGALVTALAGAAVLSTMATGRAIDRFGTRMPLLIALTVNGVALLLLPWVTSWPLLLALGALLGLGDGGVAVATHVLVGQAHEGDEAAALNRLNVFFGIGAVLGPAAAAAVGVLDIRAALLLLVVGLAQWSCAVLLLRRRMTVPRTRHHQTNEARDSRLLRSPRLWILAGLLLVYVGLELGLGAWAFTYAREAADLSGPAAALLSGGFWGALTLSRLLAPVMLRSLTTRALLVLSVCVAVVGMLTLLIGGAAVASLVTGVLIVGFGFGPVWPVTFALAARAFPSAIGSASGFLAMASAAGAAGLPWLLGSILDASGPTALIAVMFAGSLILLFLAVASVRGTATIDAPSRHHDTLGP